MADDATATALAAITPAEGLPETKVRKFDFLSPWEGADYPLPGDEKAEPKA